MGSSDSSGRCVLTLFRVAQFLWTCFEPLFQLFELQSLAKLNNYMKYIEMCNRVLIKPIAPGKSYSIVMPDDAMGVSDMVSTKAGQSCNFAGL
jgi:hypothetical protein